MSKVAGTTLPTQECEISTRNEKANAQLVVTVNKETGLATE